MLGFVRLMGGNLWQLEGYEGEKRPVKLWSKRGENVVENVVANALLRGELRPDNRPTLRGVAGSLPGPSKVVDRVWSIEGAVARNTK
jgi:hypothetical protein